MSGVTLYDFQYDAVKRMKNGCILNGGVGSGKSRTSLAYYYMLHGGRINTEEHVYMTNPKDLYIITTARKRDTYEWDKELALYRLSQDAETNAYKNKVVVDSWNNIAKYIDVQNAFFIFDEQRLVGTGAWVKSFYKITLKNKNEWILLSATPGDTWSDYAPVFIANGFYKNITEFRREHCVYAKFVQFPKIQSYMNTQKLQRLKRSLLVNMEFARETVRHHEYINCDYDTLGYKSIGKDRWNPYTNEPIQNASELCYTWRKLVNESPDRQLKTLEITEEHRRVIIFYNFDYELEILRNLPYKYGTSVAEWNGHKHQEIPDTERWVYLVQYTSGCEGWNCTTTDTMIFFSQNYSYKVTEQAVGRIDRLTTPFKDLYYYHMVSTAKIDLAIKRCLANKKRFNESSFVGSSIRS